MIFIAVLKSVLVPFAFAITSIFLPQTIFITFLIFLLLLPIDIFFSFILFHYFSFLFLLLIFLVLFSPLLLTPMLMLFLSLSLFSGLSSLSLCLCLSLCLLLLLSFFFGTIIILSSIRSTTIFSHPQYLLHIWSCINIRSCRSKHLLKPKISFFRLLTSKHHTWFYI